jgi:hypothetical protein
MEGFGLCLQYIIGMGNFPRNCQGIKLEIGNFEKIVFGNQFISLVSYIKSKLFVEVMGHPVRFQKPCLKAIGMSIYSAKTCLRGKTPPSLGPLAPASEVAGGHTLPFKKVLGRPLQQCIW